MTLGPKYSTGVVWQDFQHGQLMDLFFKIKEAKAKKEGPDVFKQSIAFLAMYVNHHFKLEEEYMDLYHYPGVENHKKEHKEFIKRVKRFRKSYEDYNDEALDNLLIALNNWIRKHILMDDKSLGDFIISCEQKS